MKIPLPSIFLLLAANACAGVPDVVEGIANYNIRSDSGNGAFNGIRESSGAIQKIIDKYLDKYQSSDTDKNGEYISAIQLSTFDHDDRETYVSGFSGHDSLSSPVTSDSLFAWGSITKGFTAAVMLKLQDENLLNLDQTLSYWFPEKFINDGNKPSDWPKEWAKVTIANLLQMTSGIPDFYTESFLNESDLFLTNWKPNDLVDKSVEYYRSGQCEKYEGCFFPGTSFSYSNTNYVIASMIADKAARAPFVQLMQNLLNQSSIQAYYHPHIAPAQYLEGKIVDGYFFDTPAYNNRPVEGVPLGFDTINTVQLSTGADGALIGNTDNMVTAVYGLFNGKILSKEMTDVLNAQYYVNANNGSSVEDVLQCTSGNTDNKGCFGLGVSTIFDDELGPIWFYEGEVGGFRSYYMWIAMKDLLVCASVNSSVSSFGGTNDNIQQLVNDIVILLLDKKIENRKESTIGMSTYNGSRKIVPTIRHWGRQHSHYLWPQSTREPEINQSVAQNKL